MAPGSGFGTLASFTYAARALWNTSSTSVAFRSGIEVRVLPGE
jgi:hypothetical protein